ncbi:MAG: hypothetical protein LBP59_00970 [Planctomycetaceae bacterium]|nr:hypothetical protein [Planctomycetaceae bacterium]
MLQKIPECRHLAGVPFRFAGGTPAIRWSRLHFRIAGVSPAFRIKKSSTVLAGYS